MNHIWLDVDPGHDDAIAILLAVHCPNIKLLGISTVHGNASAYNTAQNAARCLHAFGAPDDIFVYPGASKPLIKPAKHDPEIHGEDGLGGVQGLPESESPATQRRFQYDKDGTPIRALHGLSQAIKDAKKAGIKVAVVSCGPCTNIALFSSVYPELLDGIEQFVFMGGGVGVGNRSAVAEYNILCDPEAAQILLNIPVKKIMMPLNVTHTAIATAEVQAKLNPENTPPTDQSLRYTISTIISFFADAYKSTFGFVDGPPLHDCLCVAAISRPDMFRMKRYRVDVELNGTHTSGETVVDIWNYRDCDETWGSTGKNCLVTEFVDVAGFFDLFFECVERCDLVSPINQRDNKNR